jgi:hypothetical protein
LRTAREAAVREVAVKAIAVKERQPLTTQQAAVITILQVTHTSCNPQQILKPIHYLLVYDVFTRISTFFFPLPCKCAGGGRNKEQVCETHPGRLTCWFTSAPPRIRPWAASQLPHLAASWRVAMDGCGCSKQTGVGA